ncbi:MAG TPA: cation-translocating P-type ATPase [Gemmatimonadales bacterium]|nr:cation-translocating P-type ATPase [Gemmatimonadales bacterium]
MASPVAELPDRRPSAWATAFARRTYLAGILWALGVMTSLVTRVPDHAGWLAIRLDLAGLLYTAAAIIGGANFFGAGWRAARSRRLDMNFLMSVAIVAAVLIGEPFEAASLAFLFSTAELLERFAVDRGRRSIARLLELAPEQADRLTDGGRVETVPVAQLTVGDLIRVRPGDKIPADGRTVAGLSEVNEATITGESYPRAKSPGDLVSAGTLNLNGSLDIEVTADAAHSTLARIVELIRQSEARRAPVEHAIRRFALIYTPIVTALALGVMIGPPLLAGAPALEWFTRGLTLLVIACPCALVIATPVTVVSALTSAARHGVLIKGGEHLEALGGIRALAVDKTGTLTTGQLAVTRFEAGPGDSRRLLALVAALEARSEHPVARAILRYADARGVRPADGVEQFVASPGRGIQGVVAGVALSVGSEEQVPRETATGWGELEPGTLSVYVHADNGDRGLFVFQDEVRPAARHTVERLHHLGVRPIVMLTGDAAAAATSIAKATGVDEVQSRLRPEEKVEAVRVLKARFGRVAMLGDGVNDAAALAEATVGLAMGAAGSPATIEAADVALMGDDLARLPYAIHLARRARRTIRFNIGLALGLKALLAVGAVTGVVSLAVAVLIGDLGASLVVTGNALSLSRIRPTV